MTEWKTYRLGDICDYVTSRTSRIENYISTENMLPNKGGVCTSSNVPSGAAVEYKVGDILISNIRPYFQKIWQADCNGACSADVLCIRANNKADSKYLYYLLSQQLFFDYVMAGAKGCKMPRGDKKQIMQWQISLPSLEEQRRIAGILGAIDDKIENNRRINTNLELQAQALFEEWLCKVNTIKGTFNDIIDATLAGDWGQEKLQGNYTHEVYCIRGADIPALRNGDKGKMPIRYILERNYLVKQLRANDIVVEISGGSPTQSTGRVCMITKSLLDRLGKDVVCTNFCRAITPKNGYAIFIFLYWQMLYNKNTMFSYENGTTGIKNLNIADLISKEPINVPKHEDVDKLNVVLQPIYDQIYANGLQNEALATLRDTLLPKLMNGEIITK